MGAQFYGGYAMCMTKVSKLPPRKAGFFVFDGVRHIRNALYEHIHEPVQVQDHMNGGTKELAVTMTGRATRFPLANFEGEWTDLEIEPT